MKEETKEAIKITSLVGIVVITMVALVLSFVHIVDRAKEHGRTAKPIKLIVTK